MWNHDVIAEPARAKRADELWLQAKLFVAARTNRAGPTTDPWINQPLIADADTARLTTNRNHAPHILMAECERQLQAAVGEPHHLAAADIIHAFPEMDVAMANSGCGHLQQHFGSRRLRGGLLSQLKGRTAFADLVGFHSCASSPVSRFRRLYPFAASFLRASELKDTSNSMRCGFGFDVPPMDLRRNC